jgi:Asp-tRNA(Asn)/Glu-tRNA(Gln) amidotransferase C subunit
MIQNVRTRWNNIFEMLKRIHFLRDTIEEWFIHTVVLKLQCLKLTTNEWKQIETIIDILRFFQQITNFLNSSTQSTIHIAWIVYNTMHAHLKNCSQKLKKERSKFLQNLRSIINATQEKLKKYYDVTSSKKDLYFNLDLCFNSCDKLNYYKICYYNSFFSLHKSWI